MERLNYAVLKKSGYAGYILPQAPEKVLQFGEGNFLRAFVDYWFDLANEKAGWNGKCCLVQPIPTGLSDEINAQEGLYTLYLRGSRHGQKIDDRRVISSVSRCLNPYDPDGFAAMLEVAASDVLEIIVSNTTEAGIVYDPSCWQTDCPCASFPGKLTQVLYHRYRAGKPGVVVLACELIDDNGRALHRCVHQYIRQWGLEDGFRQYIDEECTFCGSLVDRIVPGRIRDGAEAARLAEKHGYADPLLDVGEVFGLWVIEGDDALAEKLPFHRTGLDASVFVAPDMTPYKKRKVRILNGAHTGFVPGAYLSGHDIVRECMDDPVIRGFMDRMLREEIVPVLPLDRADCLQFADAVADRFCNPFVDHALLSICLNSTSKWRTRNLPSLLDYVAQRGTLPRCLTTTLASYIAFFSHDIQDLTADGLVCRRPAGDTYICMDDRWVLEFYHAHRHDTPAQLTHAVLSNTQMWGQDLTAIPGLEATVAGQLARIRTDGAHAAFASCL